MAAVNPQQLLAGQRRKARHYAVQALYQWGMTRSSLNKIEAEFRVDNDFSNVDGVYFAEILHQVPPQLNVLDAAISGALTDRVLAEVNPVEVALLRMAVYELKDRIDVPYKVVINEAVALAKKFGANESYKFINAVLDKAVEEYRGVELQAVGRNSNISTDE